MTNLEKINAMLAHAEKYPHTKSFAFVHAWQHECKHRYDMNMHGRPDLWLWRYKLCIAYKRTGAPVSGFPLPSWNNNFHMTTETTEKLTIKDVYTLSTLNGMCIGDVHRINPAWVDNDVAGVKYRLSLTGAKHLVKYVLKIRKGGH